LTEREDPWVRERISRWPIRAPRTPSVLRLLRLLYSEDEARLLLVFDRPYTDYKTAEEVAEATGRPLEEVMAKLDDLAQRGLIMKTRSRKGYARYHLFPMVPGLFEFYFSGEMDPETKEEVKRLMDRYYHEGFGLEMVASDYPWARVLPIEKTISVNQRVESAPEILPFERVSEYIKSSWKIAIMRCACRTKNPCQHPIETCMCFDNSAAYMVERGYAREITAEEALKLLEEFEKAGLMHTTSNTQTRPQFICSCCSCSCGILSGLIRLHNPRAFAKSNFIIERDEEACTLCGRCIQVCPFGANQRHAAHDKEPARIITLTERCVGCGLCAYHCPQGALRLVKVRNQIPAETPVKAWEMVEAKRVH